MRALIADGPGGPETLKIAEVQKSAPGPGELLVKVSACGLNPVDYKIRKGYFSQGREYPAIYGYDVCGVVEEAAAGAAFSPGDEVFYYAPLTRQGSYAEYHVVQSAIVERRPEGLSAVEAASLPLAGTTALQALFRHAGLQAGETALIMGAAGGVGSLAVQMAKWKGARVIGVCSASNAGYVKNLGADHVIDYTRSDVAAAVAEVTEGEGAHAAYDLVGGESFATCVEALRPWGRLVFTNAFSGWEARLMETVNRARPKNLAIHCQLAQNSGEDMRALAGLAREGFIKPQVDRVISLREVAEAHRRLETMHGRGKIVIDMLR